MAVCPAHGEGDFGAGAPLRSRVTRAAVPRSARRSRCPGEGKGKVKVLPGCALQSCQLRFCHLAPLCLCQFSGGIFKGIRCGWQPGLKGRSRGEASGSRRGAFQG